MSRNYVTKAERARIAALPPLERACAEGGGTLVTVPLPSREVFNRELAKYAPGCGSPITIVPFGGQMRCGAWLQHLDGRKTQEFCDYCKHES
jgi:hypothetical protein